MTETKRFQWNERIDGGIVDEFIVDNLTKKELDEEDMCELLNELSEENEQLKQQLKSIEDSFKFSCTENHIEFNKDKLKVEDTHTELTLKDGKLCISVFIPQLNEYVKFFYLVTGRKMEREFINYEGDVE